MAKTIGWEKVGKHLWLYDTFRGLAVAQSTSQERAGVQAIYERDTNEDAVRTMFEPYRNVTIVKGVVPDSLAEGPDRIAFLHLDMNAAKAEIGALDTLRERLAIGAIVLMDDYARLELQGLHEALKSWFRTHDHEPLELPTGQGLVVWRG